MCCVNVSCFVLSADDEQCVCSVSLRGPLRPTSQLPFRRAGVENVLNALAAPFAPVERPGRLRKLSTDEKI